MPSPPLLKSFKKKNRERTRGHFFESTEIHSLYLLMPYDLTKGWIYSRGAHPCWPRSTGVQKNQMHSGHQQ
jgi:hypothetical protein